MPDEPPPDEPLPDEPPPDEPLPGGEQNVQGLVGMILGIAAIPLICCFVGLPVGGAAVLVSYRGLQKANAGQATNRQQAVTGLICGAAAFVLGVIYVLLWIFIGRFNFT